MVGVAIRAIGALPSWKKVFHARFAPHMQKDREDTSNLLLF